MEESSRVDIRNNKGTKKKMMEEGRHKTDRAEQHTKANWELNSPAAVQATLVIPWETWAKDDAIEVCHRVTALS